MVWAELTRKRGIEGQRQRQQKMASLANTLVYGPPFLTEDDIPGSSLNGRDPNRLKNSELKFWLKCRGDSCKQGSYGSWKIWKVLEFYYRIFQDWKVLEK